MMLSAAFAAAEEADDHIRANGADVAHEVADDLVVPPFLDRLFHAERKAEVNGAREVLFRAVKAMDRQQFFRPEHAERLPELWTDLVLTAVASRRGHEGRSHSAAVPEHRQQPVVLIVGVR